MHPTGHVTHWTSMVGAELSKTAPAAFSEVHFLGESGLKREKVWIRVPRKVSKLGWEKRNSWLFAIRRRLEGNKMDAILNFTFKNLFVFSVGNTGPSIRANSKSLWEKQFKKKQPGRRHHRKSTPVPWAQAPEGFWKACPPCCLAEGNCLYDIFGFLRTTCSISSTKLPRTSPLLLPLVVKQKKKKHWPQHDSLDLNQMPTVSFQLD